MLRLHDGRLQPCSPPVRRLADDEGLPLGLVADLVDVDACELVLQRLGQGLELRLVLRRHRVKEALQRRLLHRGALVCTGLFCGNWSWVSFPAGQTNGSSGASVSLV